MMEIAMILLVPAVAPPTLAARPVTAAAQHENLSSWPERFVVQLPPAPNEGLIGLTVPPAVFGRSSATLADVRLAGADGQAIPYALRVRSPRSEPTPLPGKAFNPVTRGDGTLECSIDLGRHPGEHNEVSIPLGGRSYHRPVEVDGSDDGTAWNKLLDGVFLVHLQVGPQSIDQRRFSYPASRYRYLRVRVGPDLTKSDRTPRLESIQVWQTVRLPGVIDTYPATLLRSDPGRYQGSYATAYVIDLGAGNVPVSALLIDVEQGEFARPFTLEAANDNGPWQTVTRGDLQPPAGGSAVEITFPETTARRLRLQVIDSSNTPLTIRDPRFRTARREILFRLPPAQRPPLYLYAGNLAAQAPNYDFASRLPREARAERTATVWAAEANPTYLAPPKPWSERHPWLVDAVLIVAAVVVAGVLLVLMRTAIRRHDATAALG